MGAGGALCSAGAYAERPAGGAGGRSRQGTRSTAWPAACGTERQQPSVPRPSHPGTQAGLLSTGAPTSLSSPPSHRSSPRGSSRPPAWASFHVWLVPTSELWLHHQPPTSPPASAIPSHPRRACPSTRLLRRTGLSDRPCPSACALRTPTEGFTCPNLAAFSSSFLGQWVALSPLNGSPPTSAGHFAGFPRRQLKVL